jgi:hypothetical protein
MELDKVHFQLGDYPVYCTCWVSREGGYFTKRYPVSFHAWRRKKKTKFFAQKKPYGLKIFEFPCLVLDIVAADKTQVAAKVIYVFSRETWLRYQSDLSSKPLDLSENGVVLQPNEVW